MGRRFENIRITSQPCYKPRRAHSGSIRMARVRETCAVLCQASGAHRVGLAFARHPRRKATLTPARSALSTFLVAGTTIPNDPSFLERWDCDPWPAATPVPAHSLRGRPLRICVRRHETVTRANCRDRGKECKFETSGNPSALQNQSARHHREGAKKSGSSHDRHRQDRCE